ncbi:MAG: hypothetical protein HXX10_14800 [Rhodoplanes sp.]|uniref:hypothetical protein n=1 Tax=Rhodoplanes sp. TaxID=1968906 RepID=UPI001809BE4D|nr:hypothetical protein [Rhodoplanes sp.]NVO15296.1 hypothetical protein [Rhodoplanes sp.]
MQPRVPWFCPRGRGGGQIRERSFQLQRHDVLLIPVVLLDIELAAFRARADLSVSPERMTFVALELFDALLIGNRRATRRGVSKSLSMNGFFERIRKSADTGMAGCPDRGSARFPKNRKSARGVEPGMSRRFVAA